MILERRVQSWVEVSTDVTVSGVRTDWGSWLERGHSVLSSHSCLPIRSRRR